MKDHTPATLQGAARAVRTSLATLKNSPLLIASPKLREALPHLSDLLECLEDVDDRVRIAEQNAARVSDRLAALEAWMRQEQGLAGAVEAWQPTT